MYSHKTEWIFSETPLLALSWLFYDMVSSLINTLRGECLCLREIYINVNKLLAVLLLLVYPLFFYCTLLLPAKFFIPFFILMLLPYFCLFVVHVNKTIILVFEAFVYHFKNTIFIFVTILYCALRVKPNGRMCWLRFRWKVLCVVHSRGYVKEKFRS